MASSGNFPLWSPLIKGAVNLSKGNTRFDGTTSSRGAMTSFAVPTGTKFYVECLVTHATGYNIVFGVANPEFNVGAYDESDATMNGILFRANNSSSWDTCSLTNGVRGSFGSNVGTTSARVLAMTVNRVDNEIKMYLDNSLQHTISISATEVYHIVCSFTGGANSAIHMNINGGHDSTGAGDFSAGSATDENGFGEFQNTPATGFLAPSSANLPISADIDPAQTDDDYPQKQFNPILYTGNASTQNITGVGFQPDLVWIKNRGASAGHKIYDSSRGATKMLSSNNTDATITVSTGLTSFDSDGFTLGSNSGSNGSSNTYVAWCWRATSGTEVTNNDGTGTSYVQANQNAGFSIVRYAGTGSALTIGHGLSQEPDITIIKDRDASVNWIVYTKLVDGSLDYFFLNTNASKGDSGLTGANDSIWNFNSASSYSNTSGRNYIMYNWHSVEGYSKFGSYEGNGNSDGTFVYTGFRPRMLFIKGADNASNWEVRDTARDTFNPLDTTLLWDDSGAEASSVSVYGIDILANGFKLRTTSANYNTSGNTYIYGAWGDVSYKYNNTF